MSVGAGTARVIVSPGSERVVSVGPGKEAVSWNSNNGAKEKAFEAGATATAAAINLSLQAISSVPVAKGDKKAPGTIVLMSDLLQAHDADTLRTLLLSSHYRRPIDFGA